VAHVTGVNPFRAAVATRTRSYEAAAGLVIVAPGKQFLWGTSDLSGEEIALVEEEDQPDVSPEPAGVGDLLEEVERPPCGWCSRPRTAPDRTLAATNMTAVTFSKVGRGAQE
jgi:hypothetical protein